jgi:hypothetical protein
MSKHREFGAAIQHYIPLCCTILFNCFFDNVGFIVFISNFTSDELTVNVSSQLNMSTFY